jgi:hypothetical protein
MIDKVIGLGRNMTSCGSKRGALMDVEKKSILYRNTKGSVLFELSIDQDIGDGVFYAGEGLLTARKIELRGNQILFEYPDGKTVGRMYIANLDSYRPQAISVFNDMFIEPTVNVPMELFDKIDSDMLSITLVTEGPKIKITQSRSDGSAILEHEISTFYDYGEKQEVTFFTGDLLVLRGYIKQLKLGIKKNSPISVLATTNFGGTIRGLISYQTFD